MEGGDLMLFDLFTSTRAIIQNGEAAQVRFVLTRALERNDIWPGFQPILDIHSGHIVGFEVLARWNDPDDGEISPAEFIPQLEFHRLIDTLCDALISQACLLARDWHKRIFLAFNLSPTQFSSNNLANRVASIVEKSNFPLNRIFLELTEGALISDTNKADVVLRELHASGMHVAIDDFGTGYSSLARLEAFPFRKLKIDRCFVNAIDTDARKRRIVASVIGLGQSLNMSVIAEGIETREEEATLRALGCRLGQGWLFGRATKAEDAAKLIATCGVGPADTAILDASPYQRLHQLKTFYEEAPIGLCYVDRQFRYIDVNERFAALHNRSPQEMIGRSIREIMDKATAAQVEKILCSALTSNKPIHSQYHMAGRDVLISNNRVTETDPNIVIGFTAVSIDITENVMIQRTLAEREENFRQILHMYPDIVWSATADGTFDYISPTAVDVPGESMRERIDRWLARIYETDRQWVISDWRTWIQRVEPYQAEFRVLGLDGSCRWIRSRAHPKLDSNGHVIRWHGVATDITELVNLRDQFANISTT